MNLFNEAEASADAETEELFEEIRPSSYKRKKRKGKKEEDISNFETVETRTYKLEGEARYCPKCGAMKRPEKEPYLHKLSRNSRVFCSLEIELQKTLHEEEAQTRSV